MAMLSIFVSLSEAEKNGVSAALCTAKQRIQAAGIAAEKLASVHAPMGLELNAETPEEIALSILAEINMIQRGGTGEPMIQAEAVDKAEVLNE
ncbi:MAG TPA: XdhC family protein [Anaerolineales bacterium]|nr:XdhC family protein [Anaerolineales bacterium]